MSETYPKLSPTLPTALVATLGRWEVKILKKMTTIGWNGWNKLFFRLLKSSQIVVQAYLQLKMILCYKILRDIIIFGWSLQKYTSIILMKNLKNEQKPLYNWEIRTILTPSWFRGVAEEPTRGQYCPFFEVI